MEKAPSGGSPGHVATEDVVNVAGGMIGGFDVGKILVLVSMRKRRVKEDVDVFFCVSLWPCVRAAGC